jgi:hypothetical protein
MYEWHCVYASRLPLIHAPTDGRIREDLEAELRTNSLFRDLLICVPPYSPSINTVYGSFLPI